MVGGVSFDCGQILQLAIATPGQCINLFCDYETFGEHQWPETGIFEFLKALPAEVLKKQNLSFATPCEIAAKNKPGR